MLQLYKYLYIQVGLRDNRSSSLVLCHSIMWMLLIS